MCSSLFGIWGPLYCGERPDCDPFSCLHQFGGPYYRVMYIYKYEKILRVNVSVHFRLVWVMNVRWVRAKMKLCAGISLLLSKSTKGVARSSFSSYGRIAINNTHTFTSYKPWSVLIKTIIAHAQIPSSKFIVICLNFSDALWAQERITERGMSSARCRMQTPPSAIFFGLV